MANEVLKSLEQLFSTRIFRIPNYQRGYSWGKQQLNDLWEDLSNIVDNRPYYIGMVSIEEAPQEDFIQWKEDSWYFEEKPNLKAYYVVDGQQRLTTIILLIAKIVEVALKHNIEKIGMINLKEVIKTYLYITYGEPGMAQFKSYIFGYVYNNPSNLHFKWLLGDKKVTVERSTSYTLNLDYAYNEFFDTKVNELFDLEGEKGLKNLLLKITSSLRFQEFIINNEEFDTYVAFETMNNRGKRLSHLELLKNRLMYLSTLFYDRHFKTMSQVTLLQDEINDCWSSIYEQLGKNPSKPLDDDDMLDEHWKIYFSYNRSESNAYAVYLLQEHFTVKSVMHFLDRKEQEELAKKTAEEEREEEPSENIDETTEVVVEGAENSETVAEVEEKIEKDVVSDKDIQDYVFGLKSFSENWFYSFYPDYCNRLTNEEKEWITKLNRLGMGNFQALVAVLINSKFEAEDKIRCLKAIERFIFIVFRLAQYNQSFISYDIYNFAKEINKGRGDINSFIEKLQTEADSIAVSPATINRFCETTKNLFSRQQGFYSWQTKNYFLFEYEYEHRATTGVSRLNWDDFTDSSKKGKISIEHIYPQKPYSLYWKNQFRGFNKEQKVRFTNSLGNLLPLAQTFNISLQNFDFGVKKNGHTLNNGEHRRGYSEGSYSEQEVAKYEDWGPKQVVERGKKLLTFLEKRWGITIGDDDKLKILGFYDFDPLRDQGDELDFCIRGVHQNEVLNFLYTRSEISSFLYSEFTEYLIGLRLVFTEELNPKADDSIVLKNKNGDIISTISLRKESIRVNGNFKDNGCGDNYFNKKTDYLFDIKYWINVGREEDFELAKNIIFGKVETNI